VATKAVCIPVERNSVEDLAQQDVLDVLEEWFGFFDQPHATARFGKPAIAIMAEPFVADGPFQLSGIGVPQQVRRGEAKQIAEIPGGVERDDRPRVFDHGGRSGEPSLDRGRRLRSLSGLNERRPQGGAGGQETDELPGPVARRIRVFVPGRQRQIPHPHAALPDGALAPAGHRLRVPVVGEERRGQTGSELGVPVRHRRRSSGP
jgi:hypothetical protein